MPPEFQADLAALDQMEDEALWRIARSHKTTTEMARYTLLLEQNQEQVLSEAEKQELHELRTQSDRLMLLKAQAAALLRWRGYNVPPI